MSETIEMARRDPGQRLYLPQVRARLAVIDRLAKIIPDVDDLVLEKHFRDTARAFTAADLRRDWRAHEIARLRKQCWLILRRHPDIRSTWTPIAKAYHRDHTTVCTQTAMYAEQIKAGYLPGEPPKLQWICDQLARRGWKPFMAEDML